MNKPIMRKMHLGATAANLMLAATSAFAFTPSSHSSLASQSNFGSFFHHATSTSSPYSTKAKSLSCRRHQHHYATASSDNDTGSSTSSFELLGLSDDLITAAQKMNWEVPTPVQQLSIPAILNMAGNGHDDSSEIDGVGSSLWCEGPTGSGKTGGFALPLLQILLQQKRLRNNDYYNTRQGSISTLILCPTRELAAQTGTVLQRLISFLPKKKRDNRNRYYHEKEDDDDATTISIDVIHGGVPMEPQVARLASKRRSGDNIDVLVATPGRLVDLLRHSDNVDNDPLMSALERRIMDALDGKSTDGGGDDGGSNGKKKRKKGGRRGPSMDSSLTLKEIQEMDLDREDDDGRATLDEMLLQLDYLVVDEADRLLGGAFQDEVDELLALFPNNNRVGKKSSNAETKLKTLLFSATFPEEIEARVDRVLSRMSVGVPLRVSTTAAMRQRVPLLSDDSEQDEDGTDSDGLSNRQKKHLANTTPIKNVLPDIAPKIQHRVIRLNERDRTQALRYLLEQSEDGTMDRVLVFVATRYSSEHVSKKLRRYDIAAAELHGKLDQDARERRLKAFRSGKTRVLVCTDLAARGIDVEGLPVVVNYDLPRSASDYTHRTGRTGRAGKSGTAISFVCAKSEPHFDFIEKKELLQQHGQMIEREVLPGFAPGEASWEIEAAAATMGVPGAMHSQKGLEHDRMFGGVKSRRMSKKDKLRQAAAKAARKNK